MHGAEQMQRPRMLKLLDVLSRCEAAQGSRLQAAQLLGTRGRQVWLTCALAARRAGPRTGASDRAGRRLE